MRTKSVFISAVVSFLVIVAIYNDGFGQTICATCPGNDVSGTKASAFGLGNAVSGDYSFAAGRNSEIRSTTQFASHYSNIIGSWSLIEKGPHSNVIGSFSQALNDFSFVFGTYAKAKGSYSFAIGSHVEAWSGGSFVIGGGRIDAKLVNSNSNSLMIGFNSAFPTIFVGQTPVGYQSGRVGIGNITSPEAKLHIRADAGEDANLMLQATGTGQKAMLLFNGGPGIISNLDPYAPLQFYAGGGKQLGIHLDGATGNVGIGLDDPSAQLDIGGSLRIRGGNPVAGKVLTSDAQGVATWQTPSDGGSNWTVNGSNIYRPSGYVGIGTTSPTAPLHVRRAVTGSYGYVHRIELTGTATFVNSTKALEIKANTTNDAFLVYGDGRIETKGAHLLFNRTGNASIRANDVLSFRTNNVERIHITKDGNVAIGTTDPKGYKLAVKGKIITEEVVVKLHGSWPDYVFEEGYALKPLAEVGSFIDANGHLPEVPTAQQVAEDGVSLGEMNALLLKKIEELMLYTLQQQKEIDALKQQMAN